jgi:hypothetical protein
MVFNVSVFHSRDPLKMINNVCSILCDGYDEGELREFFSPEALYPGALINVSDLYGLGCVAER